MSRRRVHKITDEKVFDKYHLYHEAVQSPDEDVVVLRKMYRELVKAEPRIFREDFCGTFALSCEWLKLNPQNRAIGVDLDPEPLEYGRQHYLPKLKPLQQKRLQLLEKNVLTSGLPQSDIVVAMNFSYFIFKKRADLKKYFQNVRKSLRNKGLFVVDIFGGSLCADKNEEVTRYKNFSYFWDQASFDPIDHRAQFYIHFKLPGKPRFERVFSYDWRMWSIPEIRELMLEAGFKKTHVYWEGTTKKGEGDGIYSRTEKGEACEAWVAYIVGTTSEL